MDKFKICKLCGKVLKPTTTSCLHIKNGRTMIIQNVPCSKCPICNDEYFASAVVKYISLITDLFNSTGFEFATIDYATKSDSVELIHLTDEKEAQISNV